MSNYSFAYSISTIFLSMSRLLHRRFTFSSAVSSLLPILGKLICFSIFSCFMSVLAPDFQDKRPTSLPKIRRLVPKRPPSAPRLPTLCIPFLPKEDYFYIVFATSRSFCGPSAGTREATGSSAVLRFITLLSTSLLMSSLIESGLEESAPTFFDENGGDS